jgi:hypothetical protein
MAPDALRLPASISAAPDLHRVRREMAMLDDYYEQAKLRKMPLTLLKTSVHLAELVSENAVDLNDPRHRQRLLKFVDHIVADAPVIHISFATDPSPDFFIKIVEWFRISIHPQVLISVGVQPSIAAGCVLRTPNHYYDFSLRQHFTAHRQLLIDKLRPA